MTLHLAAWTAFDVVRVHATKSTSPESIVLVRSVCACWDKHKKHYRSTRSKPAARTALDRKQQQQLQEGQCLQQLYQVDR